MICYQIITPHFKDAICYSGNHILFKDANMSLALDLKPNFQALNASPMAAPVIQHVQGNHSLHKFEVSALGVTLLGQRYILVMQTHHF